MGNKTSKNLKELPRGAEMSAVVVTTQPLPITESVPRIDLVGSASTDVTVTCPICGSMRITLGIPPVGVGRVMTHDVVLEGCVSVSLGASISAQ
jgi:hypothetical protein